MIPSRTYVGRELLSMLEGMVELDKFPVDDQVIKKNKLKSITEMVHVSNFEGVAGLEDFACATLPTTPFDFQGKVDNFCHPTLLKIRFKIGSPPPPTLLLEEGQSQNYGASINSNGLLTLNGLLSLKFLLHMTTSFIKNHFNNCI